MQSATASSRPRVAVLLIGNELLTGKIRDENGFFMAQYFDELGFELTEISVVADQLEPIGAACRRLLGEAPILFTSGGVGPTHDDCTLEAIAKAIDRPLLRHPQMEQRLREHYKDGVSDAALKMAKLPQGTVLCASQGWPVMRLDLQAGERPFDLVENSRIYILPGIPSLLRAKLKALADTPGELPIGKKIARHRFTVEREESEIAPILQAILEEFPGIEIGSYPSWRREDDNSLRISVELIFESEDPVLAEQAYQSARERIQK